MKDKIAITVSSFAEYDPLPLERLKKKDFEIVSNALARQLDKRETLELCSGCAGILAGTEVYDSDILRKLRGLKVISRCGTGTDNIDLEAAKKIGIKIFNVPDGPTIAVAELTIGLMLTALRKVPLMDREMRSNIWNRRMGSLFRGKRVGIIGFGRIGKKVAFLAKALGADVIYYDPFIKEQESGFFNSSLNKLLEESDIISLHAPYSKENHHLLGSKEFSLIRQGVFLINCSRAKLVDEAALYSALKDGRLEGAAIDVFENEPYSGPLTALDNVILTPHIGSYAREARAEMELRAAENLIGALKEGAVK